MLKMIFVWGFHLGVAGVALGTALGAWINVGLLTWFGHSRALLAIEKEFVRSLPPVLIAAIATGAAAWAGAWMGAPLLPGRFSDIAGLRAPWRSASLAYSVVVWTFRRALPLGKFAQ